MIFKQRKWNPRLHGPSQSNRFLDERDFVYATRASYKCNRCQRTCTRMLHLPSESLFRSTDRTGCPNHLYSSRMRTSTTTERDKETTITGIFELGRPTVPSWDSAEFNHSRVRCSWTKTSQRLPGRLCVVCRMISPKRLPVS